MKIKSVIISITALIMFLFIVIFVVIGIGMMPKMNKAEIRIIGGSIWER